MSEILVNRTNVTERGNYVELAYYRDSESDNLFSYLQSQELPTGPSDAYILNENCSCMFRNCKYLSLDWVYLNTYLNFVRVKNMSWFAPGTDIYGQYEVPDIVDDLSHAFENTQNSNLMVYFNRSYGYQNLLSIANMWAESKSTTFSNYLPNYIRNMEYAFYNTDCNMQMAVPLNTIDMNSAFELSSARGNGYIHNLVRNAVAAYAETNITNMIFNNSVNLVNAMFLCSNCFNLKRVIGKNLSNLNDAALMFDSCYNLTGSLDFSQATNLTSLRALLLSRTTGVTRNKIRGTIWINSNKLNNMLDAVTSTRENLETLVLSSPNAVPNSINTFKMFAGNMMNRGNLNIVIKNFDTWNRLNTEVNEIRAMVFGESGSSLLRYDYAANVNVSIYGPDISSSQVNLLAYNNINTTKMLRYYKGSVSLNIYYAPDMGQYEDYFGIITPFA